MTNLKKMALTLQVSLLMAGLTQVPALGQTVEKYSIAKTEDGFVRTNVETGHTSLCSLTEEQLICRASIDEIRAFETTNQQLQDRISILEGKISKIEEDAKKTLSLTKPEELDQAMDLMEGFMTRFFDMAKNLNNDNNAQ